jgi:hypothetical protein
MRRRHLSVRSDFPTGVNYEHRVDAPTGLGQLAGWECGMIEDTSTRSWNDIADDWVVHSDANDYRNRYLMPRMLALLGQVAGKSTSISDAAKGGLYASSRDAAPVLPPSMAVRDSSRWPVTVRTPRASTSASYRLTRTRFLTWNHIRAPVLRRHRPLEDYDEGIAARRRREANRRRESSS